MHYKCVHMKFGTVLYRKGGDLLCSISWALAAQFSFNEPHHFQENDECNHQRTDYNKQTAIILNYAGKIVNDLIQEEIRQSSSLDTQYTNNPSSMSIFQHLEAVNRLLIDFIATCSNKHSA